MLKIKLVQPHVRLFLNDVFDFDDDDDLILNNLEKVEVSERQDHFQVKCHVSFEVKRWVKSEVNEKVK